MIRLLHPEIEVEPGRRAQQVTVLEGAVGPGAALLRVTNDTSQENAFIIRLRCEDNPYWQDAWYALQGLPQANVARSGGTEELTRAAVVASGKADQHGPNHRWIKLYISAGQTRDVQIAFYVPQDPTGRAGRYPFTVSVEQFVSGTEAGAVSGTAPAARRSRFSEVQGVAVVRPFYNWQMDLLPEDGRRVGMLRRRAPWEVIVTNKGNDWLYCDLKFARNRDVLVEAPTLRLAVPPPEPGEEQFQRSVPLTSATKLRQWRGDVIAQQVPVSASRVDAPSVAPAPEDRFPSAGGAFALGLGNVVATDTADVAQTPTDRTLSYRPPFAIFRVGGFGGFLQSGRNLVFAGIGLIALVHVWALGYEHLYLKTKAEPIVTSISQGQKLVVAGLFLNGTRILIKKDAIGAEEEVLESRMGNSQQYKATNIANVAANRILMPLQPAQRQFVECTIPYDRYKGTKVRVFVQRLGFLPWLRGVMPTVKCTTTVQIGRPEATARTSAASTASQAQIGAVLPIVDATKQLGAQAGTVTIGGQSAVVKSWSDGSVQVVVPQTATGPAEVVVTTSDNGVIRLANRVSIVAPPTPPPALPVAGATPFVPVVPVPIPRPSSVSPTVVPPPSRTGAAGGTAKTSGKGSTGGAIVPGGITTGTGIATALPAHPLPRNPITAGTVAPITGSGAFTGTVGLLSSQLQPGQTLRIRSGDVGAQGDVKVGKYKIKNWRLEDSVTIAVDLPRDIKPGRYDVRLEPKGRKRIDIKEERLEVVAAAPVASIIGVPIPPRPIGGIQAPIRPTPSPRVPSWIKAGGRVVGASGSGANVPLPVATPVSGRPAASTAISRQIGPYQLVLLGEADAAMRGLPRNPTGAGSQAQKAFAFLYQQKDATLPDIRQRTALTSGFDASQRALGGGQSGRAAALAQLAQARHREVTSLSNGQLRDAGPVTSLLRGAVSADPTLTPAHTTLARVLSKSGDSGAGLIELQTAHQQILSRTDANTAAEAIDLARTALDLGQGAIAQSAYGRALQLNPNLGRYRMVKSLRSRLAR